MRQPKRPLIRPLAAGVLIAPTLALSACPQNQPDRDRASAAQEGAHAAVGGTAVAALPTRASTPAP